MAFIEFVQPLLLVRVVTALLRNALDKRLFQEADAMYEASIKLIDMTLSFSSEEEIEKRIYFNLQNVIGRYFYRKGDFNKADYHFSIAERLIINPYTIESGIIYNNLSLVKQRVLEDKTLALFYSEKAYKIFKEQQDLTETNRHPDYHRRSIPHHRAIRKIAANTPGSRRLCRTNIVTEQR